MAKFLHTADWQLGLKLHFIPGDRGALARLERFEVVRRIARLAAERQVDAVVVAGDVMDDNAVGADTLQRTADALAAFAPIPVLLLPGNHDAATPGCALARLPTAPHVHVLLDETPVEIGGVRYLPCPLRRRHEREDPTRHIPTRQPGDPVRVVVAHGGVLDFSEEGDAPNRIDLERLAAAEVDFLALGDWHGTLGMRPWAWYAGAPEATRFKEKDPGNVLIVEVDGPGAAPRVERVPIARTRWIQKSVELTEDADVEDLIGWFERLPERSWTLVELSLRGSLGLAARARLDAAIDAASAALLHVRIATDDVVTTASEADLAALGADGWLGAAVSRLRETEDPVDRAALALLHRLVTSGRGTTEAR